jgi:hypothetical protein
MSAFAWRRYGFTAVFSVSPALAFAFLALSVAVREDASVTDRQRAGHALTFVCLIRK